MRGPLWEGHRMRPTLLVAGAAALLLVGAPIPGLAGGALLPMTIDPDEGPAGTIITVEGEGCVNPIGQVAGFVVVVTLHPVPVEPDISQTETTPGALGAWTALLVVPPDTPPGNYEVHATCAFGDEQDPELLNYEPQPFTVTALPAEPAKPVEREPTFTG